MDKYHTMSVGGNSRLHSEVIGPQSFATASHSTTITAATNDRYGTMAAGKVGSGRRSRWSTKKSKSVGTVQGSNTSTGTSTSSTFSSTAAAVPGSPSMSKSKSTGSVKGSPSHVNKSRSITSVLGRTLNKSKSIGNVVRGGHSLNKAKSVNSVLEEPSSLSKSNSSTSSVLGGANKSLSKARSSTNVQQSHQSQSPQDRDNIIMLRAVDSGLGTSSSLSKSIGSVPAHSFNKSKSLGSVGRVGHKLSMDSHLPPNFGRVSSAGTCRPRQRERRFSSSPRPLIGGGGFSSLQPSPLFLSQASLGSQTSQSSITSMVLDTAESLGISVSLRYLVEDAKMLHKKLLALSLDLDLEKIGLSDEVDSVCSEGMEEGLSHQAWREKSFSPFESDDSKGQPRPSVGSLVDELTEVEHQLSGGRTESVSSSEKPSEKGGGGSGKRSITASTATLELDELMQNLVKFEASNQDQGGEAGRKDNAQKGKSAMDDLSSMLTSLDQDMTTRHGVNTVAKGVCAACNKPILNKIVKALGKQWHPEHFTCAGCDIELGSTTYYESNGKPYCEKDYNELYAPRCAYCNGPILDRVMRALDRTWHPEHFFCTLCGKHFGTEGFHQKDGKAFCRECYYEKFAPRCRRCDKAIMEGFITAINAQWHPECFSCKVCGVTFPRGNYFEHEGEPHCEIHYHASRGTLCNSCQKPVTGKCITAMGKKWHPEHFNCAFCLKLLNKGTFKEHRQNPYCHPCYIKLFG